ncbi:putative ABC transport system ATP-binding protein [Weissella uvarum]|uniref:ABC transporter ATP-binding protein n=1 Tax=Weissella uvarum TaxID=1479233 RepID=UPI001961FCF1|nr:ABC transporter ATP-binding protein [Weissella uvarum]MBM7617341.1 putative ABC transport system ATP-binding protein [Weissella uvarum]MCM0595767.1 ABC transporter ATP-binding protein [Weissella uvarum]
MNQPILQAEHIQMTYQKGSDMSQAVLKDLSLTVAPGEFLTIMGPSGSGKSTLLNILSTLMKPTAGDVTINGRDILNMNDKDMANFRNHDMGFIFQNYNLIESLSVAENIGLPLNLQKVPTKLTRERVQKVSALLNIQDLLKKYPAQLSGGQQQRVGAARALVHEPALIFGDEPTGALDSQNAREMMQYLMQINQEKLISILMVTHDAFSASFASRILFLTDGEISGELIRGAKSREAFYQEILQALGNFDE